MKDRTLLSLVLSVHSAALRLYPGDFRITFREEMQAVFEYTAAEASINGSVALGRLFLREMFDLVWTAINERRREWLSQAKDPEAPEGETRFSRLEMLISLAVFLVPAGYLLLNAFPQSLVRELIPVLILTGIFVGTAAGLLKRLPRWSLPYLGLILSGIVFAFLFQWKAERIATSLASRFVFQSNSELGRLVLTSFWQGVLWLSLFVLVAFAILLLKMIPPFRPWARRLREDWTQISYLLYGGSMLALVWTFNDYRNETPFALIAIGCMIAGAWGYLRSSRPRQAFLALVAGATLAMWVAAIGVWLLVPSQDWAAWFQAHPSSGERWFEALQTLIVWMWMLVVMALPALVRLIPHQPDARLPE
jgi:hypothetical protein